MSGISAARITEGIILMAIESILLAIFFLYNRKPGGRKQRWQVWRWGLLALLVVLGAGFGSLNLVELEAPAISIPWIPDAPQNPIVSLLMSLPIFLAGGILGIWPAFLVGLAAGVARMLAYSGSIMTPLHVALIGAMIGWMLRCDYREWPGRLARNTLFAGLVGGVTFGLLWLIEIYASSGGSFYDGLDFTLAQIGPVMIAALAEFGVGAALAEMIRFVVGEYWYKPQQLIVGPYYRSLSARLLTILVLIGLAASVVVLAGDWLLAVNSAQNLIEQEMIQVADLAANNIPYFVQTGRSLNQAIAAEVALPIATDSLNVQTVGNSVGRFTFFRRIVFYDQTGAVLGASPSELEIDSALPFEVEAGLRVALSGVPQELVLPEWTSEQVPSMVFLAPIYTAEGDQPVGAMASWTEVDSNPLLAPVEEALDALSSGEGYVTDENGNVLLTSSQIRPQEALDLSEEREASVILSLAPNGTRQLEYDLPVPGYAWHVVIMVPQSAVQQLALQIAVRLFAVILVVGALVIALVYAISYRITRPLRLMAASAQSIARGNLAQSVQVSGEDEIAQLAGSFEAMRRSLKVRLGETDILLKTSQSVASSFELAQVLPSILQEIRSFNQADMVRLVISGPDGAISNPLEVYASGEDPGHWAGLDAQVTELCRTRGQFTLENPARARAVLDMHTLDEPLEALSAFPLRNEDQFVGVLWIGHRQPHAFTIEERNLLSILASQLAVAVANARLFHRAERESLQLMAVLEATPDAVLVIDPVGCITLANPAAEIVLSGSIQACTGKPLDQVIESPELINLILDDDGGVRSDEIQMESGQVLFASVADIVIPGTQTAGKVCVLWDITHFKKLDALKSEFVSTVSHDLRAPLTVIRGYLTMLTVVGSMNEQQKDFVNKILTSVEHMGELINNLLDLGRIEAGVGLNLERLPIETIVREVVSTYRPQAVNRKIALDVEVDSNPQPVEADPALLRQALANLVDNAIKYTPSGGRVTIRAHQQDDRQFISIADTGAGISPTDQARLFEKFYRARSKETFEVRGSGLGLAIVKSIIEQHGGQVHVDSRLGTGSRFTVELPIKAVSAD